MGYWLFAPVPASADLYDTAWPVDDFGLTDHNDKPLRLADLKGKVWVADFIFTTCHGPCPQMSLAMKKLTEQVTDPDVRFVSFSVDPEVDTPQVLRQYAAARDLTDPRWHFVTGSRQAIDEVAISMKLAARAKPLAPDANHRIVHSDRFVIVDRYGNVRGTFRPLKDEFRDLVEGVKAVAMGGEPLPGVAATQAAQEIKSLQAFPPANAALNGASAVMIVAAYVFVKRRRYTAHAVSMILALVTSAAFLASYLTYHYLKTKHGVLITRFPEHALRPVYLAILSTHTILAVVVLPMIVVTVTRAIRRQWDKHVRLARWTIWVWLYVSVTGVVVYWMLYHIAPGLPKG